MEAPGETYRDKALAGWCGKNIGGTLGTPYEGVSSTLHLHYYDPVPTEPLPNDDLDLQLVWLDLLRRRGLYITPRDLEACWLSQITYHISEYFMGQRNLAAGILSPLSGSWNNWWHNGMGAIIRSEIWAMIAPGHPDIAAAYAYMDASVDHAGDGLAGAMMMAAMQSMAFDCDDREELLDSGLRFLPADSQLRDVVELVRASHRRGVGARRVRHLLMAEFGHPADFTLIHPNVGFILLGLLYHDRFGPSICEAVNCGLDTDCTGATLGALLGIMHGARSIPRRWLEPIGDGIVVGWGVRDIQPPQTLTALTAEVENLAGRLLAEADTVRAHLKRWTNLPFIGQRTPDLWHLPPAQVVTLFADERSVVRVDLGERPVLDRNAAGVALSVYVENHGESHATFRASAGEGGVAAAKQDVHANGTAAMELKDVQVAADADGVSVDLGLEVWRDGEKLPTSPASMLCPEEWRCAKVTGTGGPEEWESVDRQGDDLSDLVPAKGEKLLLETVYRARRAMRVRLLANSTVPLRAWLNDNLVLDKRHRSACVLPACHLQNPGQGNVEHLGFTDTAFRMGGNRLRLELEGSDAREEVIFHVMEVVDHAGTPPAIQDFRLLQHATNTAPPLEAMSSSPHELPV